MNRLLLLLFVLLSVINATAQSNAYNEVINKLEQRYKTQTITFSKEAFAMLTYFDIQLKDEMKALIDDIDQMKILNINDVTTNNLIADIAQIFIQEDFSEVNVSRYVREAINCKVFINNNLFSVKEAHIVANNTIVSFFGSFKHSDIRKLIKSANKAGVLSVAY